MKLEDPVAQKQDVKPRNKNSSKPSVLYTLLWKNLTLKRKRKCGTCFEFVVPLVFIILVLALKSLTTIEDVPEGWSFDGVDFCPYTGKEKDSALSQAPCNVPYQAFFRETTPIDDLMDYLTGNDVEHEYAKLFLTHSGNQEEIAAMNLFVEHMETVGVADFGAVENFGEGIFIFGDGSNSDLEKYVKSVGYGDPFTDERPEVAASIFFESIDFATAQFQYRLRLNNTNDDLFSTILTSGDAVNELQRAIDMTNTDKYMERGFITLQQMVDSFLVAKSIENYTQFPLTQIDASDEAGFEAERNIFTPGNIRAVAFPTEPFTVDAFFEVIEGVLPLLFIMVYIMPVSQIVAVIVTEKEVRAREMMKMMGVSNFKIVLSWYLTYFGYFVILSFFITLFGKGIFPSSSDAAGGFSFLLFFLFLLFGLTILSLCYVVSTLFQKSFNGVVAGLMLFIVGFFVFFSVGENTEISSGPLLIPQISFSLALRTIVLLEKQGIGASSSLLDLEVQGFNIGRGLGWLVFDFIYLTLLGFYLDAVVPAEFGTPLPFYFFVLPSFWKKKFFEIKSFFGCADKRSVHKVDAKDADNAIEKNKYYEEVNENLKTQLKNDVGLKIRGLTKSFHTPDGIKTAVDGLNFDVFEGQILVLLGHNGAGKTTTLQMLSGMLPVSAGDAILYGNSLSSELDAVRQDLGFCPQHDVLYKELTVYDHLKFYAKIKGLSGKKLEESIDETVKHLGLTEKKFINAGSLSGGMKRKLSLGISLIGGSKIIFVDEPTSGVDTYSRRAMWEVLQDSREGRVIILTTHFMDEADLLGDRIAIMAEGRLQCIGSSLFLKNLYGAGYQLTFVKEKDCDSTAVDDLVKKFVDGGHITADIGTELTFHLPLKESASFPALFKQLDDLIERKELGVSGYGVSVTTMEEVFLKAGQSEDLLHGMEHDEDDVKSEFDLKKNGPQQSTLYTQLPTQQQKDISSKIVPFGRQFSALFMKRVRYARRDVYSCICNTLVPGLLLLAGLASIKSAASADISPPITLNTDDWNTAFSTRGFLPVLELSLNNELSFGDNRVCLQENFDDFRLEEPFSSRTDPSDPENQQRTVFTQTYVDGQSNNCSDLFPCPTDFPDTTGDAILDMGQALLTPEALFRTEIKSRRGASDFAAAIVQTEEINGEVHYSYTLLVNTTAVHSAAITANAINTALLRRSLVEYFDFDDAVFDDLDVTFTSASDNFTSIEGGQFGSLDVSFKFPSNVKAPKITTVNDPLPFTANLESIVQAVLGFVSSTSCVLAFAFVPGPMISYIVMEKEESVQIKHLQFVSGAGIVAYWMANFLFDLCSYLIPYIFGLILIQAFNIDAFTEDGAFGVIAVVFFGYGMAIIPFAYLVGHLFSKHTSALIWIIVINCITGFTLMIVSFVVDLIVDGGIAEAKWVFRLFPGFCLGDSLLQISTKSLIDPDGSFYAEDVAGANVVYLYLESFLFLGLTILIEYLQTLPGFMEMYSSLRGKKTEEIAPDNLDEDVAAEQERVVKDDEMIKSLKEKGELNEESGVKEDVLRMINLRKVYGNGKVAVKNVSLGIPEGECFGYLGINGAGKTTTMKCLTGDIFPSSGTGYIKGYNIVSDQTNVRQHVGYCSQFSSILGLLTVREHLELFCNIKLIEDVEGTVKTLLKRLSLKPFENKLAGSLSGGNKRKLNVAIAMIGSPAVMLLDEPSTGMDVASRRFMWKVIENMSEGRYDGRKTSVVLTTHSMEECEALCSRVGIMVGGQLRCLGSVQHLKSRFGMGFTVETKMEYISAAEINEKIEAARLSNIKYILEKDLKAVCAELESPERYEKMMRNETGEATVVLKKLETSGEVSTDFFVEWCLQQQRADELKAFLSEQFSGFEVVEAHDYQLTFRLAKDENTRLATVFEALETHKESLKLAEYAVSQTTLEQIFNGFAAQQEEEKGIPRGMKVNQPSPVSQLDI